MLGITQVYLFYSLKSKENLVFHLRGNYTLAPSLFQVRHNLQGTKYLK